MNTLSQTELDELRVLEEELWRAETRFDESYMRKRMAPDFIEFGRSGRTYELEEILSIESQNIDVEIPLPNLKIRQIADDVVQITYDSVVGREHGTEYAHRSSIWSRSDGDWRLRFHQGTPFTSST